MKRIFRAEFDYVKVRLLLSHLGALAGLCIIGGVVALVSRSGSDMDAEGVLMFVLFWGVMLSHFYTMASMNVGMDGGKQRTRLRFHAGLPVTMRELAAAKVCLLLTLWLATFTMTALFVGFFYLVGGISIIHMSAAICGFILWVDGESFITAQMEGVWDSWKKMRIPIVIVGFAIWFGPSLFKLASPTQMLNYCYLIASAGLKAPGLYLVGLVMIWGGYVLFTRRRSYLT